MKKAIIVASGAALSLVAFAAPAQAADGKTASGSAPSPKVVQPAWTPAPSCMSVTADPWGPLSFTVHVYNNCNDQQRSKIIIAWGGDGSCHTVPAHSGYSEKFYQGRLDGLARC